MSKTVPYTKTDLPNLDGLSVFILPGPGYGLVASLFCQMNAKKAKSFGEADLVVFLGGADVSPCLYGEKPVEEVTYCDTKRDENEGDIYDFCVRKGTPMMGICRGAQFLHVMNGGRLWQHVDNHTAYHLIYDIDEDVTLRTSSTHHQMMKFNEKMNLIACTPDPVASFFKNAEGITPNDNEIEVEACSYEDSLCFCVQGHPEFGPPEFTSWAFHKLNELLNNGFETSPETVYKQLA